MEHIQNKIAFLTIITAVLILMPVLAYGASYTPLAPLPGIANCGALTDAGVCNANSACNWNAAAKTCTTKGSLLSAYFSALFNFAIVVASILAVIVIIIAGLKYIGAAGNPAVINDAKDQIYWAILGLILALSSWMILNIINPKLVELNLGVKDTNQITSPGFEESFNGTHCGTFTESSACNADNSCKWGGNNSCEQKLCSDYADQTTCTDNLVCKWANNKCQTGAEAVAACQSLDKIACGNNAYCTWWNYYSGPGICQLSKGVWCNFNKKPLFCRTGVCGLNSETGDLCCVGTSDEYCAKNTSVITTPI